MDKYSNKSTRTHGNTSLAHGPRNNDHVFYTFSIDVLGYLILNMEVILFQIDANKNSWLNTLNIVENNEKKSIDMNLQMEALS